MKTCLECKYLNVASGDPGYSEYTPGYEWAMECSKDVWSIDPWSASTDQFRQWMRSAETCSKFALYKVTK